MLCANEPTPRIITAGGELFCFEILRGMKIFSRSSVSKF
jgi:hypothetical protein